MVGNRRMTGGEIIRLARKLRAYSQDDLAQLSGFAKSTIGNWENGRCKPAYDDVSKVVELMHFTIPELEQMKHAA
jgi:transcriptional regulator with XRE-family HTH domain